MGRSLSFASNARDWSGGLRSFLGRHARVAMFAIGMAAFSFIVGLLVVAVGDLVAAKPLFFIALPVLIAVGFAFFLSPKALVLAIVLFRGGADQVFQGTQLPGVGGLGAVLNIAVIALAASLVLRDPERVPKAAWWAWLPFVGSQLIGVAYSPDALPALRLAMAQVSTFSIFIIAFYLVEDFGSLDKLLRLVVASSVPVVIVTMIAIARGDTASSLEGMETVSGRYAGPMPHPNILAFYAVLVIGVLLYLWKRERSTASAWIKVLLVGYIFVMLGVLFATKTRSAWVAAALLFFVYGVFIERRYLIYLAASPLLALFVPEFRDRIMDLGQGNEVVQYARLNSFAWRQLLWSDALTWMSPFRYLAGYGAHGFYTHSINFFSMAGGFNWGAHSVWVQLFFDLGVLGLSAFLWLFWGCFRMLRNLVKVDLLAAVLFLTLLISYLVVSAADNMLAYLVYNWYFWFAIGGVCAVATRVSTATGTLGAGEGYAIAGRR